MLSEAKAVSVCQMIEKECCRNSLTELCEYWDVTPNDFYEFLDLAFRYLDLQE